MTKRTSGVIAVLGSALTVWGLAACGDTNGAATNHPEGAKRMAKAPVDGGVDGESSATTPGSGSTTPTPTTTTSPVPEPPGCMLDTRTVYLQDGKKIESLTARGKYWVRTLAADGTATEGDGFPRSLIDEPKMVNGPCIGKNPCVLDTRTVYFDGASKVESIFAYGQYWVWGFDANGGVVPSGGFPQLLEQTDAFATAPCLGQPAGACVIDTRSLYFEGGVKIETMTAQGKFYVYQVSPDGTRTPTGPHGQVLEQSPRMADGPCKGKPAGTCKLDTRAVYIDADGTKTEEISAYGRFWAHRLAADGTLIEATISGARLTDIARFVGPCTQ